MSSAKLLRGLFEQNRNLILYGVIGVFCAGIDFGIYNLLYWMGLNYILANVISVNGGLLCSFFLNRQYNFKTKDLILKRLLSFYLIGLFGLGTSMLFLFLMVDKLDIDVILSKLFTIVFVALLQFLLNKFITFKQSSV